LDNAATTRTDPEVVRAMLPYFTQSFANPSSSHGLGREAAAAVSNARRQVQSLLGAADADEIVFTASATEANNTALLQALHCGGRNEVIVSAVEHPAILNVCANLEKQHGLVVHRIGVDRRGRLDLDAYGRVLSRRTALVSLMWANNETGTLFPVAELAEMAHAAGALFHSDAVQAAGKVPLALAATAIELLSLSAHKFHGPKGAGVLYVRGKLHPLLRGGRQERGRRAGTENVPAIVGLGKAAELAQNRLSEDAVRIAALRDRLEHAVLAAIADCAVLGDTSNRVPGLSAIAFDGADSEEILHKLSQAGFAASAGSACASGNMEPSHVLKAMRLSYSAALGTVRFSLARDTTAADIDRLLAVLPDIVAAACVSSPYGNGRRAAALT
jgi:cysteine desulfurase